MGKISIPAFFLSLFVVVSFVSFDKLFGSAFEGAPFILSILALISHIINSLIKNNRIVHFNLPTILIILVALISTIFTFNITLDATHSYKIWVNFMKCIFLYLLIANIIRTKCELNILLVCITLSTFYIACDFTHNPYWHQGRAHYLGSNMVGDPNGLSLWVISCMPIAWALLQSSKSKIFKVIFLCSLFYYTLAVFEAQSRGGFLGLLVVFFILVYSLIKKKNLTLLVFLLCFCAILTVRYMPKQYMSRMHEIINPATDSTGSSQARLGAMRIASDYMLHHPFSKYGLGNHSYLISEYYGETLYQEDEDIFSGGNLAHNIFIQFGADTGFIPMTVYLVFIASIYLKLFQGKKIVSANPMPQETSLLLINCILISLTGFLVGSFFLPWAYRIFLFYLTGLAMAIVETTVRQEENV